MPSMVTDHKRGDRPEIQSTGARHKFAASASSAAHSPHKNIPVGGVHTGTDGFTPILHTTPNWHHEAWMISHHACPG